MQLLPINFINQKANYQQLKKKKCSYKNIFCANWGCPSIT